MKFTIALLAAFTIGTDALITRGGRKYESKSRKESDHAAEIKGRIEMETDLNPHTYWMEATIDHFNNHGAGSATYPMRYIVDKTYFDAEKGPIIFYAGNEGDVWTFFDNAGFMTTTLAQQFGALVVFGEHRYFGESLPFGDESYDRKNLEYLTVEQAMFDYVELIKMIKDTEGL